MSDKKEVDKNKNITKSANAKIREEPIKDSGKKKGILKNAKKPKNGRRGSSILLPANVIKTIVEHKKKNSL